MFPSIKTRFHTPDDEKEPQRFTFPPPCLAVGTMYLGSNASCGVRQTITLPSNPNKLNLLSPVDPRSTEAALDIFLYTRYVSSD